MQIDPWRWQLPFHFKAYYLLTYDPTVTRSQVRLRTLPSLSVWEEGVLLKRTCNVTLILKLLKETKIVKICKSLPPRKDQLTTTAWLLKETPHLCSRALPVSWATQGHWACAGDYLPTSGGKANHRRGHGVRFSREPAHSCNLGSLFYAESGCGAAVSLAREGLSESSVPGKPSAVSWGSAEQSLPQHLLGTRPRGRSLSKTGSPQLWRRFCKNNSFLLSDSWNQNGSGGPALIKFSRRFWSERELRNC